jgi:hypothetical protein
LGIGLELALFLSERPDAELARLAELLREITPPVAAWLVFPTTEMFWGGSPTAAVVTAARPVLRAYADVPFGSGTNTDFIFMQRNLPPLEQVDFLAYAINPQVHAFDNLSLGETLACLAAPVASARRLAAGRPVYVSPLTLKMRHNPYATVAEPPTPPGQLPPQVDPRQLSLFGAGWTLGSIKYVAEAGAASATYFETTGWRGVMERATGSPAPARFPSLPGAVFPLYHILADVGEFAGGGVIPSRSSDPLVVEGLILRKGDATALLLANLTPDPQRVAVACSGSTVGVRWLDADNVETAMLTPEAYRVAVRQQVAGLDGGVQLILPPYAIVRCDG